MIITIEKERDSNKVSYFLFAKITTPIMEQKHFRRFYYGYDYWCYDGYHGWNADLSWFQGSRLEMSLFSFSRKKPVLL